MANSQPPIRHVRLFRNGANQAVRIPREFELPGNEAIIRQEGRTLVIEPVASTQRALEDLFASWTPLDIEFPNVDDGLLPLDDLKL